MVSQFCVTYVTDDACHSNAKRPLIRRRVGARRKQQRNQNSNEAADGALLYSVGVHG